MSALIFREVVGDLFAAPKTHSLAHCVAADLKMGAGIAIKFRDTFKQIDKLKQQNVRAGGVAVLQDQSRFIYYLITKNDTYKKPTYQDMFLSLEAMKVHMVRRLMKNQIPHFMLQNLLQKQNNVSKLSIPRIGCGLDGLKWEKVKDQLMEVFGDEPFEIDVYTLKKD